MTFWKCVIGGILFAQYRALSFDFTEYLESCCVLVPADLDKRSQKAKLLLPYCNNAHFCGLGMLFATIEYENV
jgi:hypothetical protein